MSARFRKISFESWRNRWHSDEFTPEDFHNEDVGQVLAVLMYLESSNVALHTCGENVLVMLTFC